MGVCSSVCLCAVNRHQLEKCAWAIERQHHNKEGQISECVDSKRLLLCIFLTLTVFLLRFFWLWLLLLLGIFVYTLHNMQQNSWYILNEEWFRFSLLVIVVDVFVYVFAIQSKLFCISTNFGCARCEYKIPI